MTTYLEAILLGLLQGIAEFLPISSSGHLVIAGELLRRATGSASDPEANLRLNVALHAGTLLSILWVYRRDVLGLVRRPRLVALMVLATLPLVVIAVTIKDRVEAAFETPLVAGCGLLLTAACLWLTTRIDREQDDLERVSWRQAAVVGLFQAIAILPGVSRSGSTITGGLLVGLKREAATTFSFLVAIPALCGATLLMVRDVVEANDSAAVAIGPLVAGGLVACVVGIVALEGLIRVVAAGRLHWFAAYCGVVGLATIAWQIGERALTGG
jgi:undecaprenyl-diphosphatase